MATRDTGQTDTLAIVSFLLPLAIYAGLALGLILFALRGRS